VKTAEGSFGDQFVSEDHGDDADIWSDGDAEVSDSSALAPTSNKGAVPAISASLKLVMSIKLDFLEIGETSRYDTTIDPRDKSKCICSALMIDHAYSRHT
jgi:hypothetical protein